VLKVDGLVKYYRKTLAVDGISFTVNDGEIVGLVGPNGAGKTTVLRCVTGIVQMTQGRIEVDGVDLEINEEAVKRLIAFVPEVPSPYEMLTVYEHLRFIAMAYKTLGNFDERAYELMQRFDLYDRRNDFVLSLSKGMKQKLAIACAFVHDARAILLDEPLIGIDPKGAKELKNMILDTKQRKGSVLISTHMLDTAEHLCDRIIIIQKGTIIAEGTLEELHQSAKMGRDASLEDVFLSLTEESKVIEATSVS
jgi:ABC-2 type transport system ATP-binding protein